MTAPASGGVDLLFDGSFDGCMSAISLALERPDARLVEAPGREPDLFAPVVHVQTEEARAGALLRRFARLAGEEEVLTLRLVHASDHAERLRLLLAYVRRTLAAGSSVASDLADPGVLEVRRIRDRVSREIDRLLGFLRFRRVGGARYYAPVSPDADIVGFLGPHFAARFPDQRMIIHDVRRDIAFWFSSPNSGIVDLAGMPAELRRRLAADCEPEVEALWRTYFDRIANPERTNRTLQRKLMPARYWAALVERPGGGVESRHGGEQEPVAREARQPGSFPTRP